MAFQLRETDSTTLEEMKNVAVDVEANLQNTEAELKPVEKDKIERERLISPEDRKSVV